MTANIIERLIDATEKAEAAAAAARNALNKFAETDPVKAVPAADNAFDAASMAYSVGANAEDSINDPDNTYKPGVIRIMARAAVSAGDKAYAACRDIHDCVLHVADQKGDTGRVG